MTQGILFDLDGVLVDSYQSWFRLFNKALKHFGFSQITENTFRQHWGQSTEEDVRIFMPGRNVEEVRGYFHKHFERYLPYCTVNAEARPVLAKIKALKFKMGCVTNSHRIIVAKILDEYDLGQFFQIVVTADDVARPKPSPDMLLFACQQLALSPKETVFIGDTKTDKKASKKSGCLFVGYRLSSCKMVSSLPEFLELLEEKFC
jgi:HAD superfamily hydrolase (TIGR01509 family)